MRPYAMFLPTASTANSHVFDSSTWHLSCSAAAGQFRVRGGQLHHTAAVPAANRDSPLAAASVNSELALVLLLP
jgi:hypothetical protein